MTTTEDDEGRTIRVTLRVPRDLHDWLRRVAAAERRSVNQQAIVLLTAAREAKGGPS